MPLVKHYINRVGWLRASVLGANDGILSTTSLVIGIAAATNERNTIILTALSGLIAGAMSMAAGEYISVSSQSDTEKADIEREKIELAEMPEAELEEVVKIYQNRGLSSTLAREVAVALTKHNALETHLHDELGMTDIVTARPLQAALASFASFIVGALLPLLVAVFAPLRQMIVFQYIFSLVFLVLLGAVAARAGGNPAGKSMLRISFWGTVAMGVTAMVGYVFGTAIN